MSFDKYKTRGAYHYEWYKTEAWYRKCVDRCVEFCKGTTLDVGCGDGLVVKMIADKGYEVEGIDNEPSAIKAAEKYLSGYCRVEDLDNMRAKEYEYMVCLNVIEHLKSPDNLLNILRHYITKAGIVITDVPQEHPSSSHVKEYSPEELADLFRPIGRVVPFQIDKDFHGIEVYK